MTELLLHLPGRFAIALASPTLISPLPTTRLSIVRQSSYLSQTLLLTIPELTQPRNRVLDGRLVAIWGVGERAGEIGP